MIPKEIKASPIFGEFSPEEQDRYFNLCREKVCAHVDTLYYTVSIYGDKNECPEGVEQLLNQLRAAMVQKKLCQTQYVGFYGLSLEATRFVHYEYCLRLEGECRRRKRNIYNPKARAKAREARICLCNEYQIGTNQTAPRV